MNKLFTFLSLVAFYSGCAQTTIPSAEIQIKTAVLAAPADKRDSAMVYGYSPAGDLIVLRKGLNEMVCIADDPKQPGFSVACYQRDLDPFMARGRDLKKAGKSQKEIFDIREQEVKSGKLIIPKGSALFVFSSAEENYNKVTGEITNGNFRSVVYLPYATAASTGLPLKPVAPGMPWLMDPGTHRAHIMINPPTKNQD
jgi:hypothetical protein